LHQSPSQHVSSLTNVSRKLGEIGKDVAEDARKSDEEITSDDELEELHQFMLTQRQQNSMPQSVCVGENLTANEEDKNISESESSLSEDEEEEEVIELSQALLRKLEETFAAEHVEREERILSSNNTTAEIAICDKLNDLPALLNASDTDQLLVAAEDNSVDVNRSSDTKLLASKLDEVVVDRDEDEEAKSQHASYSAQLGGSGICATPKDSQTDRVSLASAAEDGTMVNDTDDSVAKVPTSADEYADITCSNDIANSGPQEQQPSSPVPPTAVQSSHYSAVSPPSLFEESSLEQWDAEHTNTSKDIPAPADDSRRMLDADFIGDDGLINVCESPDDMFESPSSHKSAPLPAASPYYELESVCCQRNDQSSSSSSPRFSFFEAGSQMHFEVSTPVVLHETTSSPVENAQIRLQSLPEQGNQSPSMAEEVVLLDVIEANPPPSDCSTNSVISQRCNLRKVRAKTRNAISSPDLADVSRSSSTRVSDVSGTSFHHFRNPRSCPIYSDVEPDTDEDDVDRRRSPRKLSQVFSQASLQSSLSSTKSATKPCCVKLKRIDSLPQVGIIIRSRFVLSLNC